MKCKNTTSPAEPGPARRPTRLLTVRQVWETYPAFSEGSLRWLLFHRKTNGMAVAVRKIGKRLLIDEEALLRWVDEHSEVHS